MAATISFCQRHDIPFGQCGKLLVATISAEQGVGQLKRDAIARYKDPIEMALMRTIKQALNPNRNNEPRQGGVKPEQQPIPGLLLP